MTEKLKFDYLKNEKNFRKTEFFCLISKCSENVADTTFKHDIHCVKSIRIRSFLVRIFPHSDLIRGDADYLSILSPNTGKCGPEKLRIQTIFMQDSLQRHQLFLVIRSSSCELLSYIGTILIGADPTFAKVYLEIFSFSGSN